MPEVRRLGEGQGQPGAEIPRAFDLARVARQVVEPARLAIAGVPIDLAEEMENRQEVSRAFWKPAVAVAARSNSPNRRTCPPS